jgi:uncharacterized OB-fold protein
MKICPDCSRPGFDNDDSFCYADGKKLVEARVHDCGRTVTAIDKFCPRCGDSLTVEVACAKP